MKEEEKEAIEWLKNKPQECTSLINSCSYIGNKKAYAKDRTMFKAILNLIQKQQKETEFYTKSICEDYCPQLKKKDKQIELMAERINDEALGNIICKEINKEENCHKNIRCKECIKEYFEKQAEED